MRRGGLHPRGTCPLCAMEDVAFNEDGEPHGSHRRDPRHRRAAAVALLLQVIDLDPGQEKAAIAEAWRETLEAWPFADVEAAATWAAAEHLYAQHKAGAGGAPPPRLKRPACVDRLPMQRRPGLAAGRVAAHDPGGSS